MFFFIYINFFTVCPQGGIERAMYDLGSQLFKDTGQKYSHIDERRLLFHAVDWNGRIF